MNQDLLRSIPKVDDLLRSPQVVALCQRHSTPLVTQALRGTLEKLRQELLTGNRDSLPSQEELVGALTLQVEGDSLPSLRRVLNGTGVVLHTNLGRAPLSDRAVEAVVEVARGYSTLEYQVETGGRGERYSHITQALCQLTGAESALVVNNNAAAVLLILSALAKGGEVITSRGELVEIGGSFRVPEIMESCGCHLREVGATNKTHLRDYESAITEETRALLRVHTSNYKIMGFTSSVPLADLVDLAHRHHLPAIEDLGSGSLCDLGQFGLTDEPTVQQSIQAGMDIVSFSGDKLLGGPQAGVILGKESYIKQLKAHPLTRAMRVDKMTLAGLEATLQSYLRQEAQRDIPVLAMLGAQRDTLQEQAQALADLLAEALARTPNPQGITLQLQESQGQVGGGSVPTQLLPSTAVALSSQGSLDQLEERFRRRPLPIIGRIAQDRYLLDVRTLSAQDFPLIATALEEICS